MANGTGRVRPVPHLDLKNEAQAPIQNPDQWETGTIIGITPSGKLEVSIDGAPEGLPTTIAPADSGVTAIGATVRLKRDSSGHIASVAVPDVMPDGEPPVYLGATGAFVKGIADAQVELDEAMGELDTKVGEAESNAAQAVADAASAQTSVNGVNARMTSVAEPSVRPNGASLVAGDEWFVDDGAGQIVDVRIWDGTSWVPYKLVLSSLAVAGSVGNILLENGAVDATKITASESLWAKIGVFAEITTQMLVAGGATITGELLANTINLASDLIAGDPAGIHTVLDGAGLHVQDGTSRLMDLGVTAGPTGVSMRNPKTGSMQSLSGMVFGGEFFTRSDVIEIRSSGTGWTGYAHEYLSPEFVAQSERYAVIYTFQMGNSDVGAQIEAPVDMRWRRGTGGWDDPTDYTRFFVASAYTVPLENRGDLRMSVVSTVPGRTYRLFNAFRARRNDSSAGLYRIASRSALLIPI